ncbi:MAG TPA: penicillin-binding protein activator LpoB [Lentisphaeria bacterium]|nr:MAG: penicillin-binding protein activator LpoB [Lentisphaerae bacterium GWF2_38_69]HBM16517.1 penicillin-binding protein activator LpoB [Lentisphaeria bacterium]
MENKYSKIAFLATLFALISILVSCQSTVKYGDAGSATPVSTDFGSSDLQQIASTMVNSLMTFPPIVDATRNRRPILEVARVNNKTMQHIDTQSLTDSIVTKLLRSGKFRFTDKASNQETIDEIKNQQESGLYDQNTATQYGTNLAPEYLLVSNLSEIKQKQTNGGINVYYKFTMSLKNLKTGIIEWRDEKEIRKIQE